jgi:hypothetical protein
MEEKRTKSADLSNRIKNEEYQKENFFLRFESIFISKEIENEFKCFIEKQDSETNKLHFLKQVNQLQNPTKEQRKEEEILQTLIEDFLLKDSKFELPVSKRTSIVVLEMYETFLLEKSEKKKKKDDWIQNMRKIVSDVERTIKEELKHHSWRSFMRTKECEKLMKLNYRNSLICSPQVTQNFSFFDEYFLHPFIFEQDFHFADLMFKDNFKWNLLKSDEYNAFLTFFNFLPEVNDAKTSFTVKYEFLVETNFHRLAMAYHSNYCKLETDLDFKYYETLEFFQFEKLKEIFEKNNWQDLGNSPRDLTVNILHFTLPFPMSPRIYHHSASAKYNPEDESIIVILKPYVKDNLQFSKLVTTNVCLERGGSFKNTKAIPLFNYCFFKYKKINENKVLFTQVLIADFGGWASTDESMTRKLLERRGIKLKETISNMIQLFPKYKNVEEVKDLMCNEDKRGNVKDGLGKIIYELKITK